MELSVVIPCYNEEESIREMHRRVKFACEAAGLAGYEIILVNDGSKDRTLEFMRALAETDSSLIVIDLSRNHGQQLALTAGLFQTRGDYIFVLDADLQDPPELLVPMMERAKAGVDVVYGKRDERAGETKFKLVTSFLFYQLLNLLSDVPIPSDTGDFRLMSRRVLDRFKEMPEHHRFVRGMIAWVGFRQEPFHYNRDPRFAGVTKYPLLKLIPFAFEAISSFSIRPLRISLLFAIIGVVMAALLALFAVAAFFSHRAVAGWASLASIMTFFSSLQLICIGLIGEYVGRTYIQSKNRPLFIIREIYSSRSAR